MYLYITYEYKKKYICIHVSLVAPEPVLSWGIYDMFRLPFVMPQSGDAPPGVEESKFDTEGLKGVGKGGGRTGNRPQLWGLLYASITTNVASDWTLWEQIFKSPLKNHEARIVWVLFEDVWTLGSELVFLFFGGWLYIL